MTAATERRTAIATVLVNRAADYVEAARLTDVKVGRAALLGAAEVAHAVGYGMTPAAVLLAALDVVRANPRPARGAAFPTEAQAWRVDAPAALNAALESL